MIPLIQKQLKLTKKQTEVLSLGLTFAPASHFDHFLAVKDLHLFARKLVFKKRYQTRQPDSTFQTAEEREAVQALESLLNEQLPTQEAAVDIIGYSIYWISLLYQLSGLMLDFLEPDTALTRIFKSPSMDFRARETTLRSQVENIFVGSSASIEDTDSKSKK